jgi:integrase
MSKTQRSTNKQLLIEWTGELRKTVEAIKGLEGKIKSLYLFSTRKGQPYTPDGFRSIWHRWMTNALDKKILEERFQERDIRAKAGSDISSEEHATQLLGHESGKTTARHYRRLPTRVKPSK